jgi:hypothetical protein
MCHTIIFKGDRGSVRSSLLGFEALLETRIHVGVVSEERGRQP